MPIRHKTRPGREIGIVIAHLFSEHERTGKSMSEFTIDIEKQLNRLGKDLQKFVERIVPLEDRGYDFTPACDIIESDDSYTILLDLPGLSKKEINVALKDNVLTVKGERAGELDESEAYRRQERSTGVFSRSFALPENVDGNETEARFQNGVLKISMPKRDVPGDSTSIPVK